jgi:DNA mismatch endonuclease (patch repair protein)
MRIDAPGQVGTSWASSAGVRRSMRSNRSKGTVPEVRLRSALHRAGLRFRKNARPLPSLRCTADVLFRRQRVAVFVDGCFWHSCPVHGTMPTLNGDWWRAKLCATVERDASNRLALEREGWNVLRFWEHEGVDHIVAVVCAAVASAGSPPHPGGQPSTLTDA